MASINSCGSVTLLIGIKWKIWKQNENCREKQKIPAANRKLAARKLKTFWKQQDLFCFFSKKLPSPLPQFRILREDEAIKMSNSLKTAGHLYKTQLENWLSKPPIFNDTSKKKARDIFFVTGFWWELVDSNHRSITQQIYSLSPLATRESSHIHLCACLNSAWLVYQSLSKNASPILKKIEVFCCNAGKWDKRCCITNNFRARRHSG